MKIYRYPRRGNESFKTENNGSRAKKQKGRERERETRFKRKSWRGVGDSFQRMLDEKRKTLTFAG